jgi:microcystin-dependent protein
MNLVVPVVGQEPGPTWASDLNADLGILDQHNHSSGQGVQITNSGININTDFSINSNNLIGVNSVRFNNLTGTIAGTAPNLGIIYEALNELYYNDGVGNVVQITKTGVINATSSGISSGTATASFSGGTLVVDSNVNTPADIQAASILIGNPGVASSNFATLQAPSALGANYNLTLPPSNGTGGTVALSYDTSNNIGLVIGGLVPTGVMLPFGGVAAPAGYLLCNGSAVSRATYSSLFAVISTAYGIGDGSTTFNLPPPGVFFRNVDTVGTYDPDFASRTAINGGNTGANVGSLQLSQVQAHTHTVNLFIGGGNVPGEAAEAGNSLASAATTSSQSPTSTQTNPVNVYANYIIKT